MNNTLGKVMTKNQGFTLIELILVIIILGVISVTAAPKFINLSSDANRAVLNGLKGAMNSASSMSQLKALVDGVDFGDGSSTVPSAFTLNGNGVTMQGGYLAVSWGNAWIHVLETNETDSSFSQPAIICEREICAAGNQTESASFLSAIDTDNIPNFSTTGTFLILWFNGFIVSDNCYAYYYHPKNGSLAPTIGTIDSGC